MACLPGKGSYTKDAPRLPSGVSWTVGMNYDGDEFNNWIEVKTISFDAQGNVYLWLDEIHSDAMSKDEVAAYYKEFGWRLN